MFGLFKKQTEEQYSATKIKADMTQSCILAFVHLYMYQQEMDIHLSYTVSYSFNELLPEYAW